MLPGSPGPNRALDPRGASVFILALERHADPEVVAAFPITSGCGSGRRRKGAIEAFREAKRVEEIVLAGPVRQSLAHRNPAGCPRRARFLARGLLKRGDDGLLSSIVRMLEDEEGFRVVGVQDILGGIVAPSGVLTRRSPDSREQADMRRGAEVLGALGTQDVGQAVAVQNGIVLGIEAVEGTDALVGRAGELRGDGAGPVLVKLSKTGQERRVDLPAIGPGTVASCVAAGFSGIAVEAGASLIIDRDVTIERADARDLFIEGWSGERV